MLLVTNQTTTNTTNRSFALCVLVPLRLVCVGGGHWWGDQLASTLTTDYAFLALAFGHYWPLTTSPAQRRQENSKLGQGDSF